jgi:hypothetical protein
VALDLLDRSRLDKRPDLHAVFESVADLHLLHALHEAAGELSFDLPMHEYAIG